MKNCALGFPFFFISIKWYGAIFFFINQNSPNFHTFAPQAHLTFMEPLGGTKAQMTESYFTHSSGLMR